MVDNDVGKIGDPKTLVQRVEPDPVSVFGERASRCVSPGPKGLPGVVEEGRVDAGQQEPAKSAGDSGIHEDMRGLRAGAHAVVAEDDRDGPKGVEYPLVPTGSKEAVVVGDPADMGVAVEQPEGAVAAPHHSRLRAERDVEPRRSLFVVLVDLVVVHALPKQEGQMGRVESRGLREGFGNSRGGYGATVGRAQNQEVAQPGQPNTAAKTRAAGASRCRSVQGPNPED